MALMGTCVGTWGLLQRHQSAAAASEANITTTGSGATGFLFHFLSAYIIPAAASDTVVTLVGYRAEAEVERFVSPALAQHWHPG
jgi:hypothetical protein